MGGSKKGCLNFKKNIKAVRVIYENMNKAHGTRRKLRRKEENSRKRNSMRKEKETQQVMKCLEAGKDRETCGWNSAC